MINFIENLIMHNLLIVGNGFDLAHNLPTAYHQFIDSIIDATIAPNGIPVIKTNIAIISLTSLFEFISYPFIYN